MPRKRVNLNWADEEFNTQRAPDITDRHWEFRSRLADVVREAVRYAGGSTGGNDGGLRQAIRNLDALQLAYDDEYSIFLFEERIGRRVRRSSLERTEILASAPRRKLKLT